MRCSNNRTIYFAGNSIIRGYAFKLSYSSLLALDPHASPVGRNDQKKLCNKEGMIPSTDSEKFDSASIDHRVSSCELQAGNIMLSVTLDYFML